MKKVLLGIGLLFVAAYLFTHGLTRTFFQQDEWNGFGYVIFLRQSPWWAWFNLLGPSHFIPLSQFYWFVMYRIFGYEAQYYALNALALHAVASFLVFLIAKRLSGSPWIGALTSLLFVTNSRSAQAFTHLAVFPATITSFIIIMLFFLYLTTVGKRAVLHRGDLIMLLGIFFTSVFLREDGLILPVLMPVYFWLFTPKVFQRKNVWFFVIFYAVIAAFFGFRVYIQTQAEQAIAITAGSFRKIYLYNALSLPFKLVVQNVFEGYDLFNAFWENKRLPYSEYHDQITIGLMYTVVYDFVILAVFNALAAFFLLVTRKIKDGLFWRSACFSVTWVLVTAFLLAAVGRPHNVVESRYLYLSSFAVLLLVAQTIVSVWQYVSRFAFGMLIRGGMVMLLLSYIWWSYTDVQTAIRRYQEQSTARKSVLLSLTRLHPQLPKQAVFYVRCVDVCRKNMDLVGVPNDLVLPFTSGPGWIFLLQYARANEQAYAPFFTRYEGKEFLWDYGAEGYRSIGDYGYGYFIDQELLVETLQREKLDASVVIGLEYDESDFTLHDISDEVRREIQTHLRYTTNN